MTLKEMLKKIETYNEVATVLGYKRQVLEINDFLIDCTCRMFTCRVSNYKELKKALSDNYTDTFVEALLKYEYFEMDKDVKLGNTIIETVLVDQ